MSHRPGWNLSIKSMASQNHVGRDKVKRIIDELMECGYLARSEQQSHDENGYLAGYDYTTRDPEGVTQEPYKVKPYKVEPYKVDRAPKKTIDKKTIDKKTIDTESVFNAFWDAYPAKRDKRKARLAFERALKRAEPEAIIAGAERYRDDPNRDEAYTKYPEGWLTADAWENGPLPVRGKTRRDEAAERALENARRLKQLRAERENDDE